MSSRIVWTAAFLLMGIPLLLLAYDGFFSRYVADDYCTAEVVQRSGLGGAEVFWYLHWSGRFAFYLIIDLLNLLGEWTVPLTPVLLLLLWLGVTAFAVQRLQSLVGRHSHKISVLLAVVVLSATLGTTPSVWQSVLWQTGAVTYALPIVAATAGLALALGDSGKLARALGLLLLVVCIGCSETAMVAVDGALGAALVGAVLLHHGPGPNRAVRRLALALMVGLLASAIVVAAPGNAARAAYFQPQDLWTSTLTALLFPLFQFFRAVLAAPGFLVLAYAVPLVVARVEVPRRSVRTSARLIVIAGGYLAIVAAGLPAFVLSGYAPPDRAWIISTLILSMTIVASGYLHGLTAPRLPARRTSPRFALIALLGLACVAFGPLQTAAADLVTADDLRAYAAGLDGFHQELRLAGASGQSSVRTAPLSTPPEVQLVEVGPDPNGFPNRCVANYYGLQSVIAAP